MVVSAGEGGAPASSVEQFLLGVVSAELGVAPERLPHTEQVLAALRASFREPLTAEEKALVDSDKGARGEASPVNCGLSLRLERALLRALAAAAGGAGDGARRLRVVLVGDDGVAGDGRSVAATLSATLSASLSSSWAPKPDRESGAEVARTLVLAGPGVASELKREAIVGAGEVQVVAVPGTLDVEAAFDPWKSGGAAREPRPAGTGTGGAASLVGTTIDGKYEIVREIGRGGFGSVCEAIDRSIGARVAIKFLNPQVARSKESLEAFKAEAKRVTDLEHPNIVGWKTFGETGDGTRYFVMEFLHGDELEKALQKEKNGRLGPRRAARILLQSLDALRNAHKKKILHLDLKPKNVFLISGDGKRDARDLVKIIDFGIGQYVGAVEALAETTPGSTSAAPRVGTGTVPAPSRPGSNPAKTSTSKTSTAKTTPIKRCTGCTPEYASPEQCGHMLSDAEIVPLDGRSDIYSLGVMAFQMLTGRLPFDAPPKEKRRDWFRLHREVAPRKVRSVHSKVPRKLAAFVDRCLAKSPDDRFADADEAFEVLDRFVNPPGWILPTQVAAAMLGLAAVGYALIPDPERPLELEIRQGDETDGVNDTEPLLLSAASPKVSLTVSGWPFGAESGTATVRRDVESTLPEEALSATFEAGQLTLAVDSARVPSAGRTTGIYVVDFEVDGVARSTERFKLVHLGKETFRISEARVGSETLEEIERAQKKVLPADLYLEVDVEARPPDALDARDSAPELSVKAGGNPRVYSNPVISPSGVAKSARFRVPLADVLEQDGNVALEYWITDRTGQVFDSKSVAVDVVTEALTITKATLAGSDSRSILGGEDAPDLDVQLNRDAVVSWKLFIGGESVPVEGGKKSTGGAYTEKLPSFDRYGKGTGFEGRIEIRATELDVVSASPSTGPETIRIAYTTDAPIAHCHLIQSGAGASLMSPGAPTFSAELKPRIRVVKGGAMSFVAELRCERDGAARTEGGTSDVTMDGPQGTFALFDLGCHEEGRHDLTLTIWRYSSVDKRSSGDGTPTRFVLVLDRSRPKVTLEPASGPRVVTSKGESWIETGLTVLEEPFEPGSEGNALDWGDPVCVRTTCPTAGAREPEVGEVVNVKVELSGGDPGPHRLGVSTLTKDGREMTDGLYTLEIRATDKAGNRSEVVMFDWIVATEPPTVSIREPATVSEGDTPGDSISWTQDSSRDWTLTVDSIDPNRTKDVMATIQCARAAGSDHECPQPVSLILSPTRDGRGGTSQWTRTGRPFSSRWSNCPVTIEVRAKPVYGEEGEKGEGRVVRMTRLGRVQTPAHVRVDWRPGGKEIPVGPMRLVQGNHRDSYRFRSRGKSDEEALLRRFSPNIVFNTKPDIEYEPSEIPDYYLDEYEVTRAEYLAFVEAESGYRALVPNADRTKIGDVVERARLRVDGDLPVTRITWDEAQAYAKWVGKRLPSWVEWEYAVRTLDYLPYAAGKTPVVGPNVVRHLVDNPGSQSNGPWKRGTGGDISQLHSIRDLSGNVSEWTCTPSIRAGNGARLAVDRGFYLSPWTRPELLELREFMGVGGSFDTDGYYFITVASVGRSDARDDLGFRCASSVKDVEDRLGGSNQNRAYVEIVDSGR